VSGDVNKAYGDGGVEILLAEEVPVFEEDGFVTAR
jgi:hypothetical protein